MAISAKLDQLFRETIFPSIDARQVRISGDVLLKNRECVIRYPQPDDDYMISDALEWFETYADAANKSPQKWIDRPYISPNERLPGKWRLVTVRTASERGEDPGVYLVLREGFATSLIESEARFSGVQGSYQDGTLVFTRYWPNIDPKLTAGLAATLKATATVTDPVMNGVKQTGTFASSAVSGQIMDGDGAGVVSQVLTQITALTADESSTIGAELAARRYIKTRDAQILQPFDFKQGTGDSLAYVFQNMNPSDETKCMTTVANDVLVSSLASGYTFVDRNWKLESNGTATFTVAFQKRGWNAWSGNTKDSYDVISYQNRGRDNEQRSKTWQAIQIADLDEAMTYLTTDTNADSGFHVIAVNPASNGEGAFNVTQTSVAKTIESAAVDGNLKGQQVQGAHGFHKTVLDFIESQYDNFSETELAGLTDAAPSGYKLASKNPGLNGDGLFRMTYRYEKVTLRAWGKNFAGDDYTAADRTDYTGPAGDRTGIRKEWTSIQLADLATAVAALKDGSTGYAAESGYIITGVNPSGGEDGGFNIVQTQKKQVNGIAVDGGRLIEPHSLQEGTLLRFVLQYDTFTKAVIDAAADPSGYDPGTVLSGAPYAGYKVVSNEVTGPGGDGLYARQIVMELVTRRSWVTGDGTEESPYVYASPDITETTNPGTDRQGYIKTWYGVDQAYIQDALDDLIDGTVPAESGYIITEAHASPGSSGSVTLRQVQVKQVDGLSATGVKVIRPHALQQGVMTRVITRYENWLASTLPAPESKVPGTDAGIISNEVEGPDGNGFYSRIIVSEVPVWRTWASAAGSPDNTEYDNKGTPKERKTREWWGIKNADRQTAANALATPESGYVTSTVRISEYAPGAAVITQVQSKIVAGTAGSELEADETRTLQPHNYQSGTLNRTVIINEDLPAKTSAYVTLSAAKTGYTLVDKKETLQGDGRWTVYAVYEKVTWRAFPESLTADITEDHYPEGIANSIYPVRIRVKTWLNVRKADQASALAWLWSNAGHDTGYLVDDVKVRNNGDGSIDLVQFTSWISTTFSKTWSLAGGTYYHLVWSGTGPSATLTSVTVMDRMWDYELRYFTSESDALAWIASGDSSYGDGAHSITPKVWRAVKKTKGTDRVATGW